MVLSIKTYIQIFIKKKKKLRLRETILSEYTNIFDDFKYNSSSSSTMTFIDYENNT